MATVERTRSVFLEPLTSAMVKRFTCIACVSCFLRCKSIERLLGTLQDGWRLQNQFSFLSRTGLLDTSLHCWCCTAGRQPDSCPCPVCWDST